MIFSQIVLVLTLVGQVAEADSARPQELEKQQIERWAEYYAKKSEAYRFQVQGEEKSLTRVPHAVLRWTNPVTGNGTTHGACFVWTSQGRPEVFASIFSYIPSKSEVKDKRVVAHAFNSLSLHPLDGFREGSRFWYPESGGIELVKIVGAPTVSKSETSRYIQLRNLARQFQATCDYGDNEHALRLIAKPLYRYAGTSPSVVDGALFAFATGTDPELLLLIEATASSDGPVWHFAAARHSHLTLRLRYKDVEVWHYVRPSRDRSRRDPRHHYLSIHGIDKRNAVISDSDVEPTGKSR